MKKTLLIALLLIPFFGISQTTKPIDGFLGIKFGASKAEVIATVNTKGGTLDDESTDIDLYFANVSLGHRPAKYLHVKLFNGNAYSGIFVFEPENEASTIGYYDGLVSDIAGAYGKGKPTVIFNDPYKAGDGYETTALSESKGFMYTNWKSNDTSIQININTKLSVVLIYTDDKVAAQAAAAQKAKEKSDF